MDADREDLLRLKARLLWHVCSGIGERISERGRPEVGFLVRPHCQHRINGPKQGLVTVPHTEPCISLSREAS